MKYLVAYDGSEYSKRAFDFTQRLLKKETDELIAASVVESQSHTFRLFQSRKTVDEALQKMRDEARKKMDDLQTVCESEKITFTPIIVEGHPREELLKLADTHQIDVMVVGSRGLGGIQKVLLGSTSEYLLQHSKCDVLVVK
eukprot:gb/GECH01004954.1/.p1 GENE.gb/GECH01004954.1/~~gb/GECH01004954.1/.p1  ORF type:complete len:142 (+),score=34.49 gb/GECH01004954.1/:1-426(+)